MPGDRTPQNAPENELPELAGAVRPLRVCRECHILKDLEDFHRDARAKEGHSRCCKECAKGRAKAWYHAHPERTIARHVERVQSGRKAISDRRYYASHKHKWVAYRQYLRSTGVLKLYKHRHYEKYKASIRLKTAAWQRDHRDRVRELHRKWERLHPEENRNKGHRRRARLRGVPSTMTPQVWRVLLERFGHACAYCGKSDGKLERDHVIPLVKGGHDTPENVVPACRSCNAHKGARIL